MEGRPSEPPGFELSKTYRTGDKALIDVSFTIPAGQVVGLIDPSGASKSTLIRCINRLVEPSAGTVHLGDLNVTALARGELRRARRRIGMIFQEFALVERLTVMENVLSGRLGYVPFWRSFTRRFPPADIEKAFQLLERMGLTDQADKRADALSGGQRQRVGIARALEQDPELLLVDEPTASLDPKTSRQIMRLILEICQERGLPAIINIHDVVLAQSFTQRIIGLQEGEVVFDGKPEELDDTVLTRIYGEEDWTAMRGKAREDGLSIEPGFYAHEIADLTGCVPEFYGKPFANVFDLVRERIGPGVPPHRIAMVGDTLHTDILGGAGMNWRTVLVLDHGLLMGFPAGSLDRLSDIRPDFIADTT